METAKDIFAIAGLGTAALILAGLWSIRKDGYYYPFTKKRI